MENSALKMLKRLSAAVATPRISVDREGSGRINGVSVITTGPALGHGFDIDAQMVQQTADALQGQPGRWTHGNLCDDGLGKHLGAWENARTETFTDDKGEEQSRALADFVFADSAHKIQPDGLATSAPDYLMDRVEEDPSSLGISIVADLSIEESLSEDEEIKARLARLEVPEDLKRADFVADPAANRTGLSALFTGTPSELAEEGTNLLARVIEKFSQERVTEFLEKALGASIVPNAAVEGRRVEMSALKVENTRLKAQIVDRRAADVDDYLESLASDSAAAQSPLEATQLEDVRSLFDCGKDALARKLGKVLVTLAVSKGENALSLKTKGDLCPPTEDPQKKAVAAEAKMLRNLGWLIEVSEDGTEITKAVEPKARN